MYNSTCEVKVKYKCRFRNSNQSVIQIKLLSEKRVYLMKKRKWVLGIIVIALFFSIAAVINQSSGILIHKKTFEAEKSSGTEQNQDQEKDQECNFDTDLDEAASSTMVITKREDINELRSDVALLFSAMQDVKEITFDIVRCTRLTFTRDWAEEPSDANLTADNLVTDTLTGIENGPFIGFIPDEQSDHFDVYQERYVK